MEGEAGAQVRTRRQAVQHGPGEPRRRATKGGGGGAAAQGGMDRQGGADAMPHDSLHAPQRVKELLSRGDLRTSSQVAMVLAHLLMSYSMRRRPGPRVLEQGGARGDVQDAAGG